MQGYRPQLDSLRAFAVAAVLARHFWLQHTNLSMLGVRLFFVLSGYLLTTILLREREAAEEKRIPLRAVLRNFYVRRILRIWPAYYFALAMAVMMGARSVAQTFAWHAFFVSNILFYIERQWFPQSAAALWTLAIEEQFYLLLPLLLLFVSRSALRPLLIAGIVAAIAFRSAAALFVSGPLDFYFILPFSQLDALCGGALLAVIQHSAGQIAWKRLLIWSLPLALLLYLGIFSQRVDFALGRAVYLLPLAAMVAGADADIAGFAGRVLSARPIVAIGRISYGIYLYHLFVAAAFDKLVSKLDYGPPADGPLRYVVLSCLTIIVATASWFLIEKPALAFRRKFCRIAQSETVIAAGPT